MEKLEEKTCQKFLPQNVSLRLCDLNPEYIMHQYPEALNGKVDFLVIGYGVGSQISDLPRFIRYAYNWLEKPKGKSRKRRKQGPKLQRSLKNA